MKSELEQYKEKRMEEPEFRAKYILAKEKLNLELMIDAIDDAVKNKNSYLTLKRRVNRLRKHVAAISL